MQPPKKEIVENPCQYMADMAERILPLSTYNFRETFRSSTDNKVVFDSDFFRIDIEWTGWDYLIGNSVSIFYGRLHAPNSDSTMTFMGEKCKCWHRIEPTLHFFDSNDPKKAVGKLYSHQLLAEYKETDFAKFLSNNRRQPEWLLHRHKLIWRNYINQITNLFDMNNSNKWVEYKIFLNQVYDIEGRNQYLAIPEDQIC